MYLVCWKTISQQKIPFTLDFLGIPTMPFIQELSHMENFTFFITQEFSYPGLYFLTFAYFLFLYFGIAPLFLKCCQYLERKRLVTKINTKPLPANQIRHEIYHSTKSIIVFGFSLLPIIYLIRENIIQLSGNSFVNVLTGVFILTIWNEIHFYTVHKILHLKPFIKSIHYVHHRSVVPTVFSVYSFHWFEAFLLSTVPISIMPFYDFSILAVFIYPLVSILLNYAGHCNYRFGRGNGPSWLQIGTHHNDHHRKGKKNFGFALYLMDKFFTK